MATTANQDFSNQQWMGMSPQLATYVNAIQTGKAKVNRRSVTYETGEGMQNQFLDAAGNTIGALDDVPGRDDIKSIKAYNQEAGGFHTLYVYVDPKTGQVAPIQDWNSQVTYGAPTNGVFFDQLASAAKTAAPYALAATAAAYGIPLAAEYMGAAGAAEGAGALAAQTAAEASSAAAAGGGAAAAGSAGAGALAAQTAAEASSGTNALAAGNAGAGALAAQTAAEASSAVPLAGAGAALPAAAAAAGAGAAAAPAAAAGTASWMLPAAVVGSSLIGANAAQKAAQTQSDAAAQANQLLAQMYATQRADLAPFTAAGVGAQNKLLTYLGLPGGTAGADYGKYTKDFGLADFTTDPGYGFRLSEGQKALERSAAARGGLLSGGTGKALTSYGQQMGSQEYQNAYNRYQTNRSNQLAPLFTLTGSGQASAAGQAAAAGNYGTGAANNLTSAGAARAAGDVGTANALTSGLGSYLNYSGQQDLLAAYNERTRQSAYRS